MKLPCLALLVLVSVSAVFCSAPGAASSFQRDLTVNVAAGRIDCFFQRATEGQLIDIEYQVIDGRLGSLDIGFVLTAPGGRVLQAPGRRQSWAFRDTAPVTGDYSFCFDNTHSTFNYKTVYFDLMIENADSEEEEDDPDSPDPYDPLDADMHLLGRDWHRRMSDLLAAMRTHLANARRLQEACSMLQARDMHYAESALSRVTLCSAGQTLAMVAIGALQVILVRSLFDERSRLHGLMKKIPMGRS